MYPLAYAAIVLLRMRIGSLRGGVWLDGIIGAFAVGALGGAIVSRRCSARSADRRLPSQRTSPGRTSTGASPTSAGPLAPCCSHGPRGSPSAPRRARSRKAGRCSCRRSPSASSRSGSRSGPTSIPCTLARESRAEARTDPLTGLGNRRSLFDDLDRLFKHADEPHGWITLPDESAAADEALRVADRRMYQRQQRSRVSTAEQSSGVLLRAHRAAPEARGARLRCRRALSGTRGTDGALQHGDRTGAPRGRPAPRGRGWCARATSGSTGSGHPDGIAGTAIPLVSRIVLVCDAFDAMTSHRPFAQALTIENALAELTRCARTQFDPLVVTAFADVIADRGAPRVALAS